jgi:hypothetical protein
VLVCVSPEVRQPGVPACDKHFGDAVQRIADLAEEFVFGAHAAVVSAGELQVLVHLVLHHLFGGELQNFCRLVIDEGNRVIQAYGKDLRS